jgi:hypothetical protein
MDDKEVGLEQAERIRFGEQAKLFLESAEWRDLVKPILDSMLIGLKDATNVDATDPTSTAIDLKARILAAQYLGEIPTFIEGYIQDATTIMQILERRRGSQSLYKKVE